MEALKQVVVPSNMCLLIAAVGALSLLYPASRRIGRRLLTLAVVLLLALSSGWTARALLEPLERATSPAILSSDASRASAIVILGAYAVDNAALPLSSRPNGAALARVIEAVHIRAHCLHCDVHVSGDQPTVRVMADLLASLGAPSERIVRDEHASNTVDSARNLAPVLRGQPFHLVTSAGHMPRALMAFRAQGLAPSPAPTDYRGPPGFSFDQLLPTPRSLQLSDLASHEYLGIFWYLLQGI